MEMSNPKTEYDKSRELLGWVASNEEEAYKLYCHYGFLKGFNIRRETQTYFAWTNRIKTKIFCCSKRGLKDDKKPNEASHNRPATRTGCLAMIQFSVGEEGLWKVTKFMVDHNHEFASVLERHLLRSARCITHDKSAALTTMVNAGIRPIDAFNYLGDESGGYENLGFMKKDFYNLLNNMKNKRIEVGDSQALVDHFKCKDNEEGGMFYWDFQLDDVGRMINFYWRDGRSRIDYDCFGDVVSFDTTYRTNKYNLVCAPFVGVNHHWQNVMFSCAFLLDERIESFEWLFKTFLKSMGNRAPKTIFIGQDQMMGATIKNVLSDTSHRLCQWHLSQNAPSHLGSLNANQEFRGLFYKCMSHCDSEEEFEETWDKMITMFTDGNHRWLNRIYEIHQKWSNAFSKDTFDGGIKSSQRSESTNSGLNGLAVKTTSLSEFMIRFKRFVKSWQENEHIEDEKSHQSVPSLAIRYSCILKQASDVYTYKIYKIFQQEFLNGCGGTNFVETSCDGNLSKFEFKMQGLASDVKIVYIDMFTLDMHCSCKKFESMGLLCSHILATLNLKNINKISEQYIVKRWTKMTKVRIHEYGENKIVSNNAKESETLFRNSAMRYAFDLVTKSQFQEETRKIFWGIMEDGEKAIKDCLKKLTSGGSSNIKDQEKINKDT